MAEPGGLLDDNRFEDEMRRLQGADVPLPPPVTSEAEIFGRAPIGPAAPEIPAAPGEAPPPAAMPILPPYIPETHGRTMQTLGENVYHLSDALRILSEHGAKFVPDVIEIYRAPEGSTWRNETTQRELWQLRKTPSGYTVSFLRRQN